ncbi:hypothetical protein [Stenotrophomonas sp.]|uniref:hypothetical protein n=1 Tax=Stenotrophomonas sp. TaxID=69392 RepID=UPI003D6D44DF
MQRDNPSGEVKMFGIFKKKKNQQHPRSNDDNGSAQGISAAALEDFSEATLGSIYPYVVPASWIEHVTPNAVISSPFSDDVHMVLVVDCHGAVRNVRPEDLASIGCSPEDAFTIAAENLDAAWRAGKFEFGIAALQDGVKIGGARGSWMAPAGALVLGNLYQAMVEHFGTTEFAAVALNQETLFAFPTDAATLGSSSLRQAIEDEFLNHHKPISRSWLLLNGEWPSAFVGSDQPSAH